jgi:hypothetical protein
VLAIAGSGGIGGGRGVVAGGGSSESFGGEGLTAEGGEGGDVGGIGIDASGGNSSNGKGGIGVLSHGGNAGSNSGGHGVLTEGGTGIGVGNSGGIGIEAIGGFGAVGATPGLAGRFEGDVEITGILNVVSGTKNFKIDHHAAVESAEVLNVYSGNVTTNRNGEAVVALPEWFEALNRDLRYQLTVIGTFAQAIIAQKVNGNRFVIRTSAPNVEVSWQVTGVRSDASMKTKVFNVEEFKPPRERGTYLNPEAYGQPADRGVERMRLSESRRRLTQRPIEAEQKQRSNR